MSIDCNKVGASSEFPQELAIASIEPLRSYTNKHSRRKLKYICPECGFTITEKRNLYRHLRFKHNMGHVLPKERVAAVKNTDPCPQCGKRFSSKQSLQKHIQCIHVLNKYLENVCPLEGCHLRFFRQKYFRGHIQNQHKMALQKETYTFSDLTEFKKWKQKYEEENQVYYSLDSDQNAVGNISRYSYFCNKWLCTSNSDGYDLNLKNTELVKIATVCPSGLIVEEDTRSGIVQITFWPVHIGHTFLIKHTYLAKEDRDILATQLRKGIHFNDIINKYRIQKLTEEKHTLVNFLCKTDIHNICREYNIVASLEQNSKPTTIHSNCSNPKEWCKELLNISYESPILYYKETGKSDEEMLLHNHESALILMTKQQKFHLEKFKNPKIYVEVFYGKDFPWNLYTLIILDDRGYSQPVAFCISNIFDKSLLQLFFDKVKQTVGVISASLFISDGSKIIYEAWSSTMTSVDNRLITPWHIEERWKKNKNLLDNASSSEKILQDLKSIRKIEDMDKFESALSEFLQKIESHGNFFEWFICNCVKIPEKWALCYWHKLQAKSSQLEILRRNLIKCFAEKSNDELMDVTVYKLLDLTRNSLYETYEQFEIHSAITKTHKDCEDFAITLISSIDNGKNKRWLIAAASGNSESNFVFVTLSKCKFENCNLKCDICQFCVHEMKCTCIESIMNFNICKHMHCFARINPNKMNKPNWSPIEEAQGAVNKLEDVKDVAMDNDTCSTISDCTIGAETDISEDEEGDNMFSNVVQTKLEHILQLSEVSDLSAKTKEEILSSLDRVVDLVKSNGLQNKDHDYCD